MKTDRQLILDLMRMVLKHPNNADLGAALHKYLSENLKDKNDKPYRNFYDYMRKTLGMSNIKTY